MALESQFSRSLKEGGGDEKNLKKNWALDQGGGKVKFRLQTTQNNKEIINQIFSHFFPFF